MMRGAFGGSGTMEETRVMGCTGFRIADYSPLKSAATMGVVIGFWLLSLASPLLLLLGVYHGCKLMTTGTNRGP